MTDCSGEAEPCRSTTMMMTIEKIGSDEHGTFIDGRVCRGPLRLGGAFACIIGFDKTWNGQDWVKVDPGPPVTISLKIIRIEAYRKTFETIDAGMTCRVHLEGTGLDRLAEGKMIE